MKNNKISFLKNLQQSQVNNDRRIQELVEENTNITNIINCINNLNLPPDKDFGLYTPLDCSRVFCSKNMDLICANRAVFFHPNNQYHHFDFVEEKRPLRLRLTHPASIGLY